MDLTLEEEGAQIVASTSYDPKFPPNVILDGDQKSKWMTTGSFPQEVIVQLATVASISRVKTWSTNVQEIEVQVCSATAPTKWEKLYDAKYQENEGNLQCEGEIVSRGEATFVKFKILSGYKEFVSLNRVSVEGSAARK